MTIIVAIDPGLTGAVALFSSDVTDRVGVYDMPVVDGEINPHRLSAIIGDWRPEAAIIERVGPMPRDGVKQAWRFSAAYTTARVVVALLNIPTVLVTPAHWKRHMLLKGGDEGKEQCRARVLQLFPSCAASFSRKKDQGRAEAAMLALYLHQIILAKKVAAYVQDRSDEIDKRKQNDPTL